MPNTLTTRTSVAEAQPLVDLDQFQPTREARITAIMNLKGGVGKTTLSLMTASALARGLRHPRTGEELIPPQRVLAIDLEKLCALTSLVLDPGLDLAPGRVARLFESVPEELITHPERSRSAGLDLISRIVVPAAEEPFFFVPADQTSIEVSDKVDGPQDFDLLDNLTLLQPYFDHIILDLPGQATGRIFRNALCATDGIIIPVDTSVNTLVSLRPFFRVIQNFRRGQNQGLQVDGIVVTKVASKVDPRFRKIQRGLEEAGVAYVFQNRIRSLMAIQDAADQGRSVFHGNDANAIQDVTNFTLEWWNRIQEVG